jgi:hypothetical protein
MLTYPDHVTVTLVQLRIIKMLFPIHSDPSEPELGDFADQWSGIFRQWMERREAIEDK